MKFLIGPWLYTVRVTSGPIYHDGAECAGLFVWRDREILISSTVPVGSRLDVLIHELRHAWREHFGAGENVEGECNNVASFCVSVWRQMAEQGGEAAVEAMHPGSQHESPPTSIKKDVKGVKVQSRQPAVAGG